MKESLSFEITREVWAVLNKRRWFGKHVEEDDIDALYAEIRAVVTNIIDERIG